ncbi:hypothetical protein H6785_03330 [Candidatus Nomurabacteria bacterium]|nr:hypothetical protein [Candidatus Kaiserbacteria bacterium]MCB9815580.1 hypothetical protein [Candidatus Nomurabacteria bacterium]
MGEKLRSLVAGFAPPAFMFVGLAILYFMLQTLGVNFKPILTIAVALSPIWLPLAIFYITFEQWMWSVEEKFKYENGRTTLRIKLPQEVLKTPEAMESILAQIHSVNSRDNLMQTYLDGKHPLVSSLELASIGGEVRFYANVPTKKVKPILEAQLYAQYPGIEVVEELVDYTAEVTWDPEKWEIMSFHMGKKDDEVFPIKTYIDFGLDKQPKEELKFEPMSPMLEYLGKAKPHERVWIQFLMVPHTKMGLKEGKLVEKDSWETAAKKVVNELMGRDKDKTGPEETDNRPILTLSERDTIAAIERNVSKYAYEVGIRAMYIAEIGKFDSDMISPLVKTFAQYDMFGRNIFKVRWRTDFNYMFFQDITGQRVLNAKKRELENYKARYYIKEEKLSAIDDFKVMSVEELATIWHIPGSSVVTPNLTRVDSVRKEAPANLPTGNF